jgi:hypothetical protein
VAQGGSIAILVEDVVVSVTTQPGQSADEVLAALAQAIGANPDLAALGITAHASAEGLVSNGLVLAGEVDDAGFGSAAAVPGLGGLWATALAALLAFFGQRRLARRAA